MTDQPQIVRIVRIVPKSGCAQAFENELAERSSERTGFPGMLSFQRMRAGTNASPEVAITTLWESREALDRYVATTGGSLLEPDAALLVEGVSVTEYELVESAEYDFLNPGD